MKKIIDGKRYDTETATEVANWRNGYNTADFNYCEESLYVTTNGKFFLVGEGGAFSKYATHHGNSSGAGSDLVPLRKCEAREWLEEKNKTEVIEKYFGDTIIDA